MEEYGTSPQDQINGEEIDSLLEKEFIEMRVKMIKKILQ